MILPASPMMSRVVRLIHERHSMGPTPSCLAISVLQISRSCKYAITMNLKCSNKRNTDLERLFNKYFGQFPHFLGSKCWILSYHESYNTDIQQNRPKSSANVLLENNLRRKFKRSIPDVYEHLHQQMQFLFIIWASMIIYVTIYKDKDAPFPNS